MANPSTFCSFVQETTACRTYTICGKQSKRVDCTIRVPALPARTYMNSAHKSNRR